MNDSKNAGNTATAINLSASEMPPRPRKLPQQGRSRLLFEAIKQSCRIILEQEGSQKLTATRISEVSGVAMGSIYQYFPNVDAIVAAVFEDMTQEQLDIARRRLESEWMEAPLERSLTSVYRGALRFHQKMLRLDRDFYCRYHSWFDLHVRFNEAQGDPEASVRVIQKLLERNQESYPCRDPAMMAFVISKAGRAVVQESLRHRPEYLEDPELPDYLTTLAFSMLERPAAAPRPRLVGREPA